jgi:DNA-binding protein
MRNLLREAMEHPGSARGSGRCRNVDIVKKIHRRDVSDIEIDDIRIYRADTTRLQAR